MTEWKPIETAPKDKLVLLYRPTAYYWGKVTTGQWNEERYSNKPKPFWEMWFKVGGIRESRAWEPTHWMPFPEAPKE